MKIVLLILFICFIQEQEINIENETKTLESEGMTAHSDKSNEEHVFKKARYAWQIKGHISTAALNGEASCDGSDNSKSDTFNDFSNLEYKQIKDTKTEDSDVNGTMPFSVTLESDTGDDSESIESGNACDYVKRDSQKHTDMIEFIGNKRKVDILNLEEGCSRPKRCRNIENTNSRNDLNTQSANAHSQPDRFVNMQAGIASAANNPDFRRAVGSILPNFQGFDIPSFIWQKQEMGCAIVDNVFNRTLEEMGLSPDPVVNLSATTRLTVENQSIESAIRNQGLRANTSQIDHNSILRNMEEMRRTATRTDFEHTQRQLSRMMASRLPSSQSVQTHSVIESDHAEKNCAMNVQTLDYKVNGKENSHTSICGPSSVGDVKFGKTFVKSTSADKENDHEESFTEFGDESNSYEENQNQEYVEEIMGPTSDKDEFISMEDSESIQCKEIAEKSPEKVLDLAVSTAIMNQGLTFE